MIVKSCYYIRSLNFESQKGLSLSSPSLCKCCKLYSSLIFLELPNMKTVEQYEWDQGV